MRALAFVEAHRPRAARSEALTTTQGDRDVGRVCSSSARWERVGHEGRLRADLWLGFSPWRDWAGPCIHGPRSFHAGAGARGGNAASAHDLTFLPLRALRYEDVRALTTKGYLELTDRECTFRRELPVLSRSGAIVNVSGSWLDALRTASARARTKKSIPVWSWRVGRGCSGRLVVGLVELARALAASAPGRGKRGRGGRSVRAAPLHAAFLTSRRQSTAAPPSRGLRSRPPTRSRLIGRVRVEGDPGRGAALPLSSCALDKPRDLQFPS
jgi:hypothetical protein